MKLKAKLVILNIILWFMLAVFAFVGMFFLMKNLSHKPYVLEPGQMEQIEKQFDTIAESLAESDSRTSITGILSSNTQALKQYGFTLVAFNNGKSEIFTGGISNQALYMVKNSLTAQPSWIFGDKLIIYSESINGYYIAAVNDSHIAYDSSLFGYLWYPIGIALIGSFIVIFISIAEYHSIFPRLKRLKYAMHQVYCGNYGKVIDTKVKRDEIGSIIIEFEMMRKQLSELSRDKEAFDRQRGEIITGITHDLKTPLTVIQGYAKGLVDGVAARTGKTNEYATKIYEMVKSMNVLVNKLAEFSKPGKDNIIYTFIDRDLVEIVKDFTSKYAIEYAAKGLTIKTEFKIYKIIASIDREQFVRVLQNLLDNCVKYKVKQQGNAKISLYEDEDNAILVIADDGEGVDEYETEYIFESYYRGDPSRTNPISGSGLGLSIVKSIVNAHRGEVIAYNDNGLSIKISLPKRRSKK